MLFADCLVRQQGEKVLQGGSWEALGKPGRVTITLGNFATQNLETEEQTRDFLKLAGQEGAEADQLIRGRTAENFKGNYRLFTMPYHCTLQYTRISIWVASRRQPPGSVALRERVSARERERERANEYD